MIEPYPLLHFIIPSCAKNAPLSSVISAILTLFYKLLILHGKRHEKPGAVWIAPGSFAIGQGIIIMLPHEN